jgi:uncharacterized protein (DUF885 family)
VIPGDRRVNLMLRVFVAILLPFLGACAATTPAARTSDELLDGLVESYFDELMALNPMVATMYGDRRFDDRLELEPSPQYRAAMGALNRRYLEAVESIDPAGLDGADSLTRELFLRERRNDLEAERFPSWRMPFDQFNGGMPEALALYGAGDSAQTFETVEDYERWMRRARQFPAWVDAAITAMREGMETGVTVPREAMARAAPSLEALVTDRVEDSMFFAPVDRLPASWPKRERQRLRQEMTALIRDTLNPAYTRLAAFVRDEYLPACRGTVAWTALPDGEAWYAYLVRYHTTLDLGEDAAGQVHRIGLAEVARIRAEMEAVKREVGFDGDLGAFFVHVRQEPSFYYERSQDLLAGYEDIRRRVNAALPRLFSQLPKADYVIRPVEAFRAESAAGAGYQSPSPDGSRPGIFYVNTFNLKAQPKFGMETLSLHEASPGHHFQGAMQIELTDLPRFRRFGGYVAYSEGWALYSESLGRELGLFRDPMSWYGRLSDEMLRAMRLVVDTGLHTQGWSREQAARYMRENSSLADTDIAAEVNRYIVWPGQALGYKIGDLRIQALRRQYAAQLGPRFDIREFHWQVLKDGALPLDLLATKLDRWAESVR